jgi:hypothetical protein
MEDFSLTSQRFILVYKALLLRSITETGRRFSQGTPVSSSNKTDCHNITEILLKVVLNTIDFYFFLVD